MRIRLKQTAMTVAITTLCMVNMTAPAFAQYVWLDEKGVKQYSDIAPSSSIPKNRILKAPNTSPRASATSISDDAAHDKDDKVTDPAVAKIKAPMTAAEKNADFQKRKKEEAEKEKKASEEAKFKAKKAKNCEQARGYQQDLESGQRIGITDKNGERSIMSDEQRNNAIRDNKRALDECK
jgi:hypothetical protein